VTIKGYMLFKAEFEGSEPHPDNAPMEDLTSFSAKDFAEAYSVYDSKDEAGMDAHEDHLTVLDAVARGDMSDADDEAYILPVSVGDDGSVTVFDEDGVREIRVYTMEQMFNGFFGMETPKAPETDPEP